MRDGINFAKRGIPAVVLITEEFWPQGEFVAESLGMPDVPKVKLPHPIAGTGSENIRNVARQVARDVIAALEAGG